MPLRFGIVGAGRMGRAIGEIAVRRGHTPGQSVDSAAELAAADWTSVDVAFEFTEPQQARANLVALVEAGVDVVCGTTGWTIDAELAAAIERAGVAVVIAPNFSPGVQLFFRVAREAARLASRLGLHDPSIAEWHHRGKRDVPSGTARRLAAIVAESDRRVREVVEGDLVDRLPDGALHVVGNRVGHEPGRHRLVFDGEHDQLTLEHSARSRDGFALGAVLAAEWIVGRPGLHSIEALIDSRLDGSSADDGGGPA